MSLGPGRACDGRGKSARQRGREREQLVACRYQILSKLILGLSDMLSSHQYEKGVIKYRRGKEERERGERMGWARLACACSDPSLN